MVVIPSVHELNLYQWVGKLCDFNVHLFMWLWKWLIKIGKVFFLLKILFSFLAQFFYLIVYDKDQVL